MTENTDLRQKLADDFSNFENVLNGHSTEALHEIRRSALAFIREKGFPTKKTEDWRYTNPENILKNNFAQDFGTAVAGDAYGNFDFSEYENSNLLVFVNGRFDKSRSRILPGKSGCFIGSLADAMKSMKETVEANFSSLAENSKGAFTAMNTAFARDGVFVLLPDNCEIAETIRVIHIADSRNGSYLIQPRNIFIAGTNAKAAIAEEFYTAGANPVFTNMVTEIHCGSGSKLEHYKIQNDLENAYHVGSIYVNQHDNSNYSNTTVTWGGNVIRNNIHAVYAGMNTECHFYGLYVLSGNEHVDNHTLADHAMPNCFSNELYKGILAGSSTGVFNGRILVRQDAQKTNAYQSNNCILLSEDAMNYSKPQLEIFADDVKCSHGATTGRLSNEEMFYLRSRGIRAEEARAILLKAFAQDVIDSVKDDVLHAKIEARLSERLKMMR